VLWVVLVLVLAIGALAVLVGYAIWLAHKAADVLSEVAQLADLGAQLADLLAQVGPPETTLGGSSTERAVGRASGRTMR
jgi:CHASE3 domain sensor protein